MFSTDNHKNCSRVVRIYWTILFSQWYQEGYCYLFYFDALCQRVICFIIWVVQGCAWVCAKDFEQSFSTIYGLESGMSMDFVSMFASNVWNIIIHKSIVRYIVAVVKMYSLNLSQHSHYDIINLYYKS
jgi:hypothetical protein